MTTLTAEQMREANKANPGMYSKAEHQAAPGFSAYEALCWNADFPNAEQYSRAEYKAAPGFGTCQGRWVDLSNPDPVLTELNEMLGAQAGRSLNIIYRDNLRYAEPYTEAEIEGLK